MPLITFKTLDEVPAELREDAKPISECSEQVQVNVVASKKISEFRDKNIALLQERDGLIAEIQPYKKVVGDRPLEEFESELSDLRAVRQRVNDGELKAPRDIEEQVMK